LPSLRPQFYEVCSMQLMRSRGTRLFTLASLKLIHWKCLKDSSLINITTQFQILNGCHVDKLLRRAIQSRGKCFKGFGSRCEVAKDATILERPPSVER